MLVVTESEHPRLTKREVLFEDFQPKCHQYTSTSVKDRQTDEQTTCRSNTALCVSIARWRQSLNENFLNPKYCDAFPKCIVRVQSKEFICPFSATHFQDFIIDVHSQPRSAEQALTAQLSSVGAGWQTCILCSGVPHVFSFTNTSFDSRQSAMLIVSYHVQHFGFIVGRLAYCGLWLQQWCCIIACSQIVSAWSTVASNSNKMQLEYAECTSNLLAFTWTATGMSKSVSWMWPGYFPLGLLLPNLAFISLSTTDGPSRQSTLTLSEQRLSEQRLSE